MKGLECSLLISLAILVALVPVRGESLSRGPLPRPFSDAPPMGLDNKTYGEDESVDSILDAFHFNIYSRTKQTEGIEFKPQRYCRSDGKCEGPFEYDLAKLKESGFNASAQTIVLLPIFWKEQDCDKSFHVETRELWLKLDDVNVIEYYMRSFTTYKKAEAVAATAARRVVILLHYLAELNGKHLSDDDFVRNIQIVGTATGAHVAGLIGQELKGRGGRARLGKIFALDPFGLIFDDLPEDRRIDKSDALLVIGIHSN